VQRFERWPVPGHVDDDGPRFLIRHCVGHFVVRDHRVVPTKVADSIHIAGRGDADEVQPVVLRGARGESDRRLRRSRQHDGMVCAEPFVGIEEAVCQIAGEEQTAQQGNHRRERARGGCSASPEWACSLAAVSGRTPTRRAGCGDRRRRGSSR